MKVIETDVLVVGGGTAGVTAALAAADYADSVLIVESGSGIGGVGTHAGIHAYYLGTKAGLQLELDSSVKDAEALFGILARGFHPDAKKLVIAERLEKQGVRILFGAIAVEATKQRDVVRSVRFETPLGTVCVHAKVTIDCTGDGDVCHLAGAGSADGREWDGAMHCFSMPPRFLNVAERRIEFKNFDAGWVDPSSAEDVSRGLLEGRRLLWMLPEMDEHECLAISSQLGVREGRHIAGKYTLQMDDLLLDRRFDDVVMPCYSHYDNHARDIANESTFCRIWVGIMNLWGQKLGGDVPYRCFLPEGVDGLLIASRALSMSRDVNTALRMQRDIHLAGEVAGTAAGLCSRSGKQPAELNIRELQARLIERGVLTEQHLSRNSRPWVVLGGDRREDEVWTESYVRKPEAQRRLIQALGTAEEGMALWWLWRAGAGATAMLEEALPQATGSRRRGIALALALHGNRRGVPELVGSVQRQDNDLLPGHEKRTPPRWIAGLLALQQLEEPGCAADVLDRLNVDDDTIRLPFYAKQLYILHYLIRVADRLSDDLKRKTIEAVSTLLAQPQLGSGWGIIRSDRVTMRWSLELTGAYLLGLLGAAAAEPMMERYTHDRRAFVRSAAVRMIDRLRRRVPNERMIGDPEKEEH